MAAVTVLGAGSWGTALAVHLARINHEVTLWAELCPRGGKRCADGSDRGARDLSVAETMQHLFSSPPFRVYTTTDVVGVEIGGAVKNVIALAAGVSDGLGFGHNSRAALITRGVARDNASRDSTRRRTSDALGALRPRGSDPHVYGALFLHRRAGPRPSRGPRR